MSSGIAPRCLAALVGVLSARGVNPTSSADRLALVRSVRGAQPVPPEPNVRWLHQSGTPRRGRAR